MASSADKTEEKREVLLVHAPGPRDLLADGTGCLRWGMHGFFSSVDSTSIGNKAFVDRTELN